MVSSWNFFVVVLTSLFFFILVLNRVKARLRNTEIRLEYVPPETDRGVALIIKIEK